MQPSDDVRPEGQPEDSGDGVRGNRTTKVETALQSAFLAVDLVAASSAEAIEKLGKQTDELQDVRTGGVRLVRYGLVIVCTVGVLRLFENLPNIALKYSLISQEPRTSIDTSRVSELGIQTNDNVWFLAMIAIGALLIVAGMLVQGMFVWRLQNKIVEEHSALMAGQLKKRFLAGDFDVEKTD